MRHSCAFLLLGSMLGSTAIAAPTIPPVLTGAPSAAAINQRCDAYVSRSTAMRHALETAKGPSTVATTLAAYDHLVEMLGDGSGESTLYRQVSPTAASRSAGEKCENRMASEFTKLSLSRPVYEHLKATKAPASDAATQLYLTRTLQSFERAGIGLDARWSGKGATIVRPGFETFDRI